MDPQINKIENQIFDQKIISNIPVEFFEYIADIVVNADYYDEIEIPENFEKFITTYKPEATNALTGLLKSQNLTEPGSNFTQAYADLFIARYKISFKEKVRYSLRRIQTPIEYGTWNKVGIENINEEHYVAFDIDNFVPKQADGFIDFDRLVEIEKNESNIEAFFSTSGSLPIVHNLMFDQFKDITTKGLLTMDNVYGRELLILFKHLSKDLLLYFSKIIYQNLRSGIHVADAVENTMAYYAQMIFPPNHKFPAEMSQLEISLSEFTRRFIKEVLTSLNKESAEQVYYEIVETILLMILQADFIPLYFYKINYREGSFFDLQDYNAHYAADLHSYEGDGSISKHPIESYGFIVNDDNMGEIIRGAFQNNILFSRFMTIFSNGSRN